MKQRIIVFTLFLIVSISYSQNQELDNKNGFKSLKLGTTIEEFSNYEVVSKANNQTTVLWTPPSASDLNYLFENKIDLLSLSFNEENQLNKIVVKLIVKGKYGDKNAKNKYNSIKGKIESVLGKAKTHPKEQISLWKGENVKMYLSLKYENGKMNDNDEFTTLHSIDLLVMSTHKLDGGNSSGF